MSDVKENKPAVPPPSKMRPKNGALFPAKAADEAEPMEAKKPVRNKLLAAIENVDLEEPTDNLNRPADPENDKEKFKDLNFRVLVSYHWRVKAVANNWNMTMKELVEAALANWIDKYGESPKSLQEMQQMKHDRKAQIRSTGM